MRMTRITILFVIAPLLLSIFFLVPLVTFGAETAEQQPCNQLGDQYREFTGGENPPGVLVENCYSTGGLVNQVIFIVLSLAGTVAVLFIIIGGFRYMTSAGNESRAEGGKKTLIWASIGLALVILAGTIVALVSRLVITGQVF